MKKEFVVEENETIADCLKRMEEAGYRPIRRMEKPLFKEEKNKNGTKYIPFAQKIIFQGIKNT